MLFQIAHWNLLLIVLLGVVGCTAVGRRDADTSFGGARVAYSVWGDGDNLTPIVFIHGWACDRSVWELQVRSAGLPAALAARRRIAIDLPGHGQSDVPPLYTADAFADAIAAVLDRECIKRAILVGHSNGVPMIRHFLKRYPDRVAALIAVDGPFRSFFPDPVQAQSLLDKLSSDEEDVFMRKLVSGILGPQMPAGERDRLMAVMLATPKQTRVGAFRVVLDASIWTDDPITTPLLMVNARQPAWDEEYLAYVRGLAPRLEYHEMTGVTHFLMIDRPREFNTLMADFIRANGP